MAAASDDGDRPVETDPMAYAGMIPDSAAELLAAGRLTLEMRALSARRAEAGRERRRLMLSATSRRGKGWAKVPLVARMVGLSEAIVNRQLAQARVERSEAAGRVSEPSG